MHQLIIRHKNKLSIYPINQKVCMVGPNTDANISINDLPVSISIVLLDNKVKFIPLGVEKNYRTFSGWGEEIAQDVPWGNNDLQFIVTSDGQAESRINVSDWDFNSMPKNPKNKTYPNEVLAFIKSALKINQVALFKRTNNFLSVIALDGMKIQDKTSFLLNTLIEENMDKVVIEVQHNAHSLIFKEPDNMTNFTLIKNSISSHTDIVLYIANPKLDAAVPMGVLSSLVYLFSHGLSLYLAYQRNSNLLRDLEEKDVFFWGKNSEMQRNKKIIDRILFSDLAILVQGDTGTGKEMIARYFAQKSGKKLVAVNCATVPRELGESFFFGHKKGSFTGALSDQMGKIEEANGGILFLDEIGELSLDLQAKLLRVLQDKMVTPIGGKAQNVQFQFISATHRNLESMVADKTFREDLFYRINEMCISLPALKDRKDDILELSQYLLQELQNEYNLKALPLSLNAQEFILNYAWPGNIRELKSVLKKSLLLNEGRELELVLMKNHRPVVKKDFNLERARAQFLKSHIDEALRATKNNKTEAARLLDIPARSLFRIISSLDHDKNDSSPGLSF